MSPAAASFRLAHRAAAWGVHVYTAIGAVLALFALQASGEARFADAFRWLAVALAIDASDGTLARLVAVKRVVPWFDGTLLDNLVDYLAYVLVPVVLLHEAALVARGMTPAAATWLVVVPLLASTYGFCRTDAKTADHYFRGFPSYWNIVAFYAWALELSAAATAAWVVGLSLLVFAPLKFIYPSRTRHYRTLTIGLGSAWAVVMIVALWMAPATPRLLLWASLTYPAYYFGLSLWLQASGRA